MGESEKKLNLMLVKGALLFLFLGLFQLFGQDLVPNKILSDEDGFSNDICRTIVQDNNGKLWFGVTNGILYYDGTEIKPFQPSKGETAIKLFQKENSIIALTIKSLYKINAVTKEFKKVDLPLTDYYHSSNTDSYIQLITNKKDTLWYDYNLKKIKAKPLEFSFPKITLGQYLINSGGKYNITFDLDTLGKGEYLSTDVKKINDSLAFIGTHNGLIRVELKNGYPTTKRFLHQLRIDCIFVDRDKNLWIGNADNGIHFIHKNNYLNYFKLIRDNEEKVNCWSVFTIDSTVYFASKKGLSRLDGQEDDLTIATKDISCVTAFDLEKSLYIGTIAKGVLKYSNGNVEQIYFNPNLVLDNTIMQIFNKADTLICISKESIIFLNEDQVVKTITNEELGIEPYVMYVNKKADKYWLSTTTGVLKCDLNFNVLNRYKSNTSRVICMAEFNGEEAVFASMEGGLQSIKKDSLVTYHPSENYNLFCPSYDSTDASYWTSSGGGIFYSNDENNFMFNLENGLPITNFNQAGYLKLKNEIIFAGHGGIFKFNPKHFLNTPTLPSVEIKINNACPQDEEIELEYDQGVVLIALNPILVTDKNMFEITYFVGETEYQLNSAKQLNLKLEYGTTFFRCVVKNKLTEESKEMKYSFIRTTPVWLKLWFKILVGILIILILTGFYFFIKYLITRKKLRAQKQQTKVDNERLRISRELHDNIGARLSYIISSIDLEKHNKNADFKSLESINSFARGTMAELRETIWAVGNKQVNLSELAHRIEHYCAEVNEFSEIIIVSKSSIFEDKELKPIETINLYRITQEAINNAIKYSKAKEISVAMTDSSIEISDNGVGFSLDESSYGNGLINMKIRSEECNAKLKITSTIEKGTQISIIF